LKKHITYLNDSNSILTLTTGTGAATVTLAAGKDKMIYNDGSDEIHDAIANLAITTLATSGAVTLGAQATTGITVGGIPFYYGDTGSIYTHDVSGTESTAQYNTAYGLTAMDAITTGDHNTAIGYEAGGAITTGYLNVLVGFEAGANIIGAEQNTAVGYRALKGATSGSLNVAIGTSALQVPLILNKAI
jgi:hypothetical protein